MNSKQSDRETAISTPSKNNKNIIIEIAHMQQFSIFLNAVFSFGRINNPFYCPLSITQLLLITALIILRWLTAVANRLRRWFRTDGAVGGRRSAPRPCERLHDGSAHRNGERLFIDTWRTWRTAARFAEEFILILREPHRSLARPGGRERFNRADRGARLGLARLATHNSDARARHDGERSCFI